MQEVKRASCSVLARDIPRITGGTSRNFFAFLKWHRTWLSALKSCCSLSIHRDGEHTEFSSFRQSQILGRGLPWTLGKQRFSSNCVVNIMHILSKTIPRKTTILIRSLYTFDEVYMYVCRVYDSVTKSFRRTIYIPRCGNFTCQEFRLPQINANYLERQQIFRSDKFTAV